MGGKVHLAVVGCGGIAQLVHIPSALRLGNARLVAVCDLYPEVAKAVAEKYGVRRWYTDYMEMFRREDINAVINTTWHSAHAKVTIDSAEAGKHVFVEKPMAVTVEECIKMIDACRRNGVKLMVGFMKRFDPGLRWVKGLIDDGELGRVFTVNSWYCDTAIHMRYVEGFIGGFIRPHKPPGVSPYKPTEDHHLNMLLAHGVHHADLLLWIGGEVSRVYAKYRRVGEDYVSTSILEFKSGASGFFQLLGLVRGDWDEGLAVHGAGGSAEAKIRFPYFKWRSNVRVYLANRGEYVSKLFPYRDMYLAELQHFVDCIVKDREPSPSGLDGLRAQKLIYAIHESAKLGKGVATDLG